MTLRTSALLAASALALAACSKSQPPPQPSGAAAQAVPGAPQAAGRPRLVFFMNPNGRPCQMQDQILREMGPALTAAADVIYYRTTEPAEIRAFEYYGIRSLPQLIVTDATGRELRRATPGIQAAEQVRQLVTIQGS